MTDHHDDLASAYLDGQLSPEESARVESDPRLMAEVEALAGVVERLQSEEAPVDAGTRQRHLSAALAAFDQLGLDPSSAPTNVIALDTAGGRAGGEPTPVYPQPDDMARRTARVASAPAHDDDLQARRRRSRQRQGLPSWLSAAAALLVIGGGIGWFVSRQDQSQDTANVSFDAESAEGSGSNDAALSQEAESGAPLTTVVNAAEAAKSAEDNAAGGSSDIQAAVPADATTAAAAASAPPSTTTVPAPTAATSTTRSVTTAAPVSSTAPSTAAPGGLAFTSAPTGAEVQARLTSTGGSPQPAGGASCGAEVTPPAGTTLTGYVPITVSGVAGEALFYKAVSGSGGTTVLVVRTSSCQPFS